MTRARAQRKRNDKFQKIGAQKEASLSKLQILEHALMSLEDKMEQQQVPHEPAKAEVFVPNMPQPPAWKKNEGPTNPACELVNNITDEQLKQMVGEGSVETGIADSGATSSCGKKVFSNCGRYDINTLSLVTTGLPSNKVFRYAAGFLGVTDEIKHLPFDIRGKAKEIHITPGLENHLILTNKFVEEDYVQVFDREEVNVYDANDIEIRTTRGAVLRG